MQSIRDRGIDYVAQEAVTLSSMPVWRDGRLQPRPFTLRLFIAKVGDGWQVLPGGFVRIADDIDARAVSLQHGAATADAWVLAHGPVGGDHAAADARNACRCSAPAGLLPSRAADNLFWVGRYVERAEATLRLVRAIVNRVADRRRRAGHRPHRFAARRVERRAQRHRSSRRRPSPRARCSRAPISTERCRGSSPPPARPLPSFATASRRMPGARSTISPT